MDRNKCFWRFVSIVTWNNYVAVIVTGKYLKPVITMFVNLVTPVMHVFLLIVLHFYIEYHFNVHYTSGDTLRLQQCSTYVFHTVNSFIIHR